MKLFKKIGDYVSNFIYVWKVLKTSVHTPDMYKLMDNILKFAVDVQQRKKPMLTQIAVMDMGSGEKLFNMVSLWAGVGDANPIERIKHLKAQNEQMKELLRQSKKTLEVGANDDLVLNIKIVLDVFE